MKSRTLTDPKGREVAITAMEFELLRALIEHLNQVLSRDQLLTMTRNREWEPFDRSIDIRITACGARSRTIRRIRAPSRPCAARATCSFLQISFNRFGLVTDAPARPAPDYTARP